MASVSRFLAHAGVRRNLTLSASSRRYSTPSASVDDVQDSEETLAAAALQARRDKSRLKPWHRNELHGLFIYDPEAPRVAFIKNNVTAKRKLLAKYGTEATGIPLGQAWPSTSELRDLKEREAVTYPHTLQEMMEQVWQQRQAQAQKLADREAQIEDRVQKLAGWMKELRQRQQRKLDDAAAAQRRKDALTEEVRRHFNYTVTVKDPRFQEMYDRLEKEQKKADKEAKKQARFDKAVHKVKLEATVAES